MSNKIGVYFDAANIGGGLDVEALAAGVKSKWDSLVAVVRVFPVLAENAATISKDIEENGLDGVLICGPSPRQDTDLYRFPVLTERVNLREQCVLSYEDPSGKPWKRACTAFSLWAVASPASPQPLRLPRAATRSCWSKRAIASAVP